MRFIDRVSAQLKSDLGGLGFGRSSGNRCGPRRRGEMRAALQLAIRPDFESAPPGRAALSLPCERALCRGADICLLISVLVGVRALASFSYSCVRRSHPRHAPCTPCP